MNELLQRHIYHKALSRYVCAMCSQARRLVLTCFSIVLCGGKCGESWVCHLGVEELLLIRFQEIGRKSGKVLR